MTSACQQGTFQKQTDENRQTGPSSVPSRVDNVSVGSFFQRLTQLPTSQDDDVAVQHSVHVRGLPICLPEQKRGFCIQLPLRALGFGLCAYHRCLDCGLEPIYTFCLHLGSTQCCDVLETLAFELDLNTGLVSPLFHCRVYRDSTVPVLALF